MVIFHDFYAEDTYVSMSQNITIYGYYQTPWGRLTITLCASRDCQQIVSTPTPIFWQNSKRLQQITQEYCYGVQAVTFAKQQLQEQHSSIVLSHVGDSYLAELTNKDAPEICLASFRKLFTQVVQWLHTYVQQGIELPRPPLYFANQATSLMLYQTLMEYVPLGQTCTYGQLATLCIKKLPPITVGQILHKNRHLLLVSCHRIVAKNMLGGYNAGMKLKQQLLDFEKKMARN